MHTPGHTPGSQCFHVDGRLVSGDTLFLEGCGRTDLPGSDPEQMYDSLQTTGVDARRHDRLPRPPLLACRRAATMESIKRDSNYVFRPRSKEQWLRCSAAELHLSGVESSGSNRQAHANETIAKWYVTMIATSIHRLPATNRFQPEDRVADDERRRAEHDQPVARRPAEHRHQHDHREIDVDRDSQTLCTGTAR